MVEEWWKRSGGRGGVEEEWWKRNGGRGMVEEEWWKRNDGGGVVEKEWGLKSGGYRNVPPVLSKIETRMFYFLMKFIYTHIYLYLISS